MGQALGAEQLESVARLFGVLAESTRLGLLQVLRAGPRAVGDLVAELGAKQANVSKQLGVLYAAGLVTRQRHGNEVHYAIADPLVFELCDLVCGKLRRDALRQAEAFRPRGRRAARAGE